MNWVWFRNDLRLSDHAALSHAMSLQKPLTALFILNPEQHQIHGEAPQKYEFIKAHINDLVTRLKKLGVNSVIHTVGTFGEVPKFFESLVKNNSIDGLFFNRNYWLNEMKRDQGVEQVMLAADIAVNSFHSNYLLPPSQVRKGDGGMYHVFTPYKNNFIEQLKAAYQQPLPIPEASNKQELSGDSPEMLPVEFKLSEYWPIGEAAVAERIKSFLQQANYQQERDFPAIAGTSSLSPYLAIGVISARQCLAHALKVEGEAAFNSTWVSELIWRDFYNDLMHEYPKLAKHQTFKASAKDDWVRDQELLEKWQLGQTGFPIIDAGMRQLLAEGWMHNRVRMLVASFLCKLCLLDWRQGEAYFMTHLLDGDLASNNGGWQWSSATGCDAAPYFRIFNPTTQSKKFDPDGTYIKTYVPELKEVPAKEIHDPSTDTRKKCTYPEPVIDYTQARKQALNWFKD